MNEYAPRGLRLIEVEKQDLTDLPDIVDIIDDVVLLASPGDDRVPSEVQAFISLFRARTAATAWNFASADWAGVASRRRSGSSTGYGDWLSAGSCPNRSPVV